MSGSQGMASVEGVEHVDPPPWLPLVASDHEVRSVHGDAGRVIKNNKVSGTFTQETWMRLRRYEKGQGWLDCYSPEDLAWVNERLSNAHMAAFGFERIVDGGQARDLPWCTCYFPPAVEPYKNRSIDASVILHLGKPYHPVSCRAPRLRSGGPIAKGV